MVFADILLGKNEFLNYPHQLYLMNGKTAPQACLHLLLSSMLNLVLLFARLHDVVNHLIKKGNPQQDNYFEQGENIIKNIRQNIVLASLLNSLRKIRSVQINTNLFKGT